MNTQIITSSEFNRDSSQAKRASEQGPVIITDRGTPSHVLMTYAEFQRLAGDDKTIAEALAMAGIENIPFDPPRLDETPSAARFD